MADTSAQQRTATGRRSEPFPREAAMGLVKRLPPYGRLAWSVARDPAVPAARRGALMAAAAYLLSPIDLVPGVIPVIGQLDDLLVVMVGLRIAMTGLSPTRRRHHLERVGLDDSALSEDIAALRSLGTWALRRGLDVVRGGLGRSTPLRGRMARAGDRALNRSSEAARAMTGRLRRRTEHDEGPLTATR